MYVCIELCSQVRKLVSLVAGLQIVNLHVQTYTYKMVILVLMHAPATASDTMSSVSTSLSFAQCRYTPSLDACW